jgi:hypothetical protein
MNHQSMPANVGSDDGLGRVAPKRDVVGLLRNLERHGEDNIWRTAKDAREELEQLREMLEDLSKAVWMLDRSGFIGTTDEYSETECSHLLGIARQTVDAYTAYKRPNVRANLDPTAPHDYE